MEDVTTSVARLYEGHPYPPPTRDLTEAIERGGFQVGDPSIWGPMLWPEGRPRNKLKILVAGCGSSQAAWIAYTNRDSEVFGVDLSEASLAHERFLQDQHRLTNLRLFRGDLLEVAGIGSNFDLVICTGVLHHMEDPDAGVRALADVMAPGAALACMLYAPTKRTGVYMLQDAFRRMGIKPDAVGIAFVRNTLASLPPWHFAQFYINAATELQHDAALVDTFLHPQDRPYSVPQVLALVEDNGLAFQGWFDNAVYYPDGVPWLQPEALQRLAALPDREQWAAREMLSPGNPTHYFFARKGAPPDIALSSPGWAKLVPHPTPGLRVVAPNQFKRMAHTFNLSPTDAALLALADGKRTLAAIAAQGADRNDVRILFEQLWKRGHVMLTTR